MILHHQINEKDMKRFYYIVALALGLFVTLPAGAQQENEQARRRGPESSRGERTDTDQHATLQDLTVRAQDMNERMTQNPDNAPWMRVIYRRIDLLDEPNAPLYYPTRPMNGQMNLFTTIFTLVSENKLPAYEYLDGYEDFSPAHRVVLKEMLDRFHIYYEEIPGRGNEPTTFVVNESDIPSADVRSFYVKEAWYFDQNNSGFDVKTLALCQILSSSRDIGETTMGMFWIQYENLRPYLTTRQIMTSNLNNAMTFSIDDYFRRRMFNGEIIKTQNLLNLPLQAYCPTPDSLKSEQDRIEAQLVAFEKALWLQPDTAQVTPQNVKKTKGVSTAARAKTVKSAEPKAAKVKAPKSAAPATSVRSVRRR